MIITRIHSGETQTQAALRELQEELGIEHVYWNSDDDPLSQLPVGPGDHAVVDRDPLVRERVGQQRRADPHVAQLASGDLADDPGHR